MNAKLPRWDDLEVFLAVAREGTLARAAQKLAIDASTVQRRVGKLEASLRTRLFDRSQRGYALTSTGEELLGHVLGIEREVLSLGRRIGGRDESLDGTVRVATVDDIAIHVLSPLLREFHDRHPMVSVTVDVHADFRDLSRREADVALRFGTKPRIGDLVAKHLCRVDMGLYASGAYLRRAGRPSRLEDLGAHAIVMGNEQFARLPMEQLLERHAPGRAAFRGNSMLVRMAAIRDGIGIGLLPCFLGEGVRALQRIDLERPELYGDLWLLVHVDLRTNARVRAFVDFIHTEITAQHARFEHPK